MSARLGQEVTAVGLFQATVHGDQAAVEGSLRSGVGPDTQDDHGDTPLVLAAATGRCGASTCCSTPAPTQISPGEMA